MAAHPGWVYDLLVQNLTSYLKAAFTGQLLRLKKLAAELDDGRGIARTVESIKDNKGLSALHFAAAEGKLDVCNYLIHVLKLHVDVKDGKGDTPLLHASLGGHLSTAAYLLEKGANPDVKNDAGYTPLHFTAFEGYTGLVELLLSKGVNVDAVCEFGTPLNRASGKGRQEIVKILLEHHANPNVSFHDIFTPLSSCVLAGSLACLKLLLEAGADPNAGSCGVTPLILATDEGEKEMVDCLLQAGGDANVINEFGLAPIELAALNNRLEVVQILYPATSPIPTYTDWSIDGIMRHVHSEQAIEQRKLKVMETLKESKLKGDDAFQKKDYLTAILWYTRGIEINPGNAILLSNQSLCWARLKEGDNALSDAQGCMTLAPKWPKAYYRAGAAWALLDKLDKAVVAFSMGLELDPNNKELRKALQEAEAKRNSQKL